MDLTLGQSIMGLFKALQYVRVCARMRMSAHVHNQRPRADHTCSVNTTAELPVGSVQVGVSRELISASVILFMKHRQPGRASSQQLKGTSTKSGGQGPQGDTVRGEQKGTTGAHQNWSCCEQQWQTGLSIGRCSETPRGLMGRPWLGAQIRRTCWLLRVEERECHLQGEQQSHEDKEADRTKLTTNLVPAAGC